MSASLLLLVAALSLGTGLPCPSAASTLRGRVLDAQTGAPLPGADVALHGNEGRIVQSTSTDGEGRYEFRGVAPGRYSVTACKDGFQSVTYGERPPIRDKTVIEVGGGAERAGIDFALQRLSAISGRVVDELGQPVSRVEVSAEIRYEDEDGLPRRFALSGTITDDLGQFRIPELKPGTYYIVAEPPALVTLGWNDVLDAIEDEEPAKNVPIYYPGTTDPAAAARVRLTPGKHFEVTLALGRPVRTARLSGVVVDAQGRPPQPGATMMLSAPHGWFKHVPVRQDGAFTVSGLLPGKYSLDVRLGPEETPLERAVSSAKISDGDVSGVVVRTRPGATVSGRVVFEGAAARPADRVDIRVFEVSEDPPDLCSLARSAADDGTFTLTPLFGKCLIGVDEVPGWIVKAVTVKGRDITDTPMPFTSGERILDATIVFTNRVTHVHVAVRAPDGQPADSSYLVIYPDDPANWGLYKRRHHRETWVQDATPVTVDALPPGDYLAFALTASAALEDTDEPWLALVERMRKIATKFSLREGETKDLVVKPVGLDGK